MSKFEMAAFLRKEGWKTWVHGDWMDPVYPERDYCKSMLDAYRVAKRRKDARERRALRKAGFVFCDDGMWAFDSPHISHWCPNRYYTQSEALALLAQGGKEA